MTVLVDSKATGITREQYEGNAAVLIDKLRAEPGFIAHYSWEEDGGMRVVEVWESAEQATAWFENNVKPRIPVDISPQNHELVKMVTP
jgi:heme-degrading monooxygenase HmoA